MTFNKFEFFSLGLKWFYKVLKQMWDFAIRNSCRLRKSYVVENILLESRFWEHWIVRVPMIRNEFEEAVAQIPKNNIHNMSKIMTSGFFSMSVNALKNCSKHWTWIYCRCLCVHHTLYLLTEIRFNQWLLSLSSKAFIFVATTKKWVLWTNIFKGQSMAIAKQNAYYG